MQVVAGLVVAELPGGGKVIFAGDPGLCVKVRQFAGFANGDLRVVLLLQNPSTEDRTVTVKLSADLPVPVIDLMGTRRMMTPTGGKLAIPMQVEVPVFLLLEK